MNNSTKAVLLSALVIPGAGHIYLKRYITATILIGVALIALVFLITVAVEKALIISDQILAGEVPLDIAVISELVSKPAVGGQAQLVEFATYGLVIAWLFGIVDSYRVGRTPNIQTTE